MHIYIFNEYRHTYIMKKIIGAAYWGEAEQAIYVLARELLSVIIHLWQFMFKYEKLSVITW